MGLTVPEAYGGAGADYVSYALAVEALAAVDAGTAVTLSVHLMIAAALERLGDDAQKARYLPKLASGEALAGFALTEPDAGSDAACAAPRGAMGTNGSYAGASSGARTAALQP
jgi:alkylation response protein AidB-like acyl-CoA dehydrogenase